MDVFDSEVGCKTDIAAVIGSDDVIQTHWGMELCLGKPVGSCAEKVVVRVERVQKTIFP